MLKGKVCVVAGAGSIRPGIGNGRATAILFAQEGGKVACIDLNKEAADETVRMIEEAVGSKRNESDAYASASAYAYAANVAVESEAKRVVEEIVAKYGRIDVLFNNVGIGFGRLGLNVSESDWDQVMSVNLKSVIFMSKYVVAVMKNQEPNTGGAIINNASLAGVHGHPLFAYSTSKAGVINLTKSMAVALARHKIRVNCVAPGFIDTPMVEQIKDERRDLLISIRVPMQRHGRAEEVAGVVLFLAADKLSSFVTGQTIIPDGGFSAM